MSECRNFIEGILATCWSCLAALAWSIYVSSLNKDAVLLLIQPQGVRECSFYTILCTNSDPPSVQERQLIAAHHV
jgi:hypothetical protein